MNTLPPELQRAEALADDLARAIKVAETVREARASIRLEEAKELLQLLNDSIRSAREAVAADRAAYPERYVKKPYQSEPRSGYTASAQFTEGDPFVRYTFLWPDKYTPLPQEYKNYTQVPFSELDIVDDAKTEEQERKFQEFLRRYSFLNPIMGKKGK